MSTFGRSHQGQPDELVGFEQSLLRVEDPECVATSGKTHHAIVKFNGRNDTRVSGRAYSSAEGRAVWPRTDEACCRLGKTWMSSPCARPMRWPRGSLPIPASRRSAAIDTGRMPRACAAARRRPPQVADRFHLVLNLRGAVQQELSRLRQCLVVPHCALAIAVTPTDNHVVTRPRRRRSPSWITSTVSCRSDARCSSNAFISSNACKRPAAPRRPSCDRPASAAPQCATGFA
jgi:hypothetical protein